MQQHRQDNRRDHRCKGRARIQKQYLRDDKSQAHLQRRPERTEPDDQDTEHRTERDRQKDALGIGIPGALWRQQGTGRDRCDLREDDFPVMQIFRGSRHAADQEYGQQQRQDFFQMHESLTFCVRT